MLFKYISYAHKNQYSIAELFLAGVFFCSFTGRLSYAFANCNLIVLLFQIADALYYNAALTLSILQKFGVATEIFGLWLQMLQQVRKSGVRANFKR